ncbi:LAFE_0A03950g1_1 [Lachancea fermentati]|uniref:LAFE_0A03950g1_1 n=1 Tax=Lachancea fermentati TaxID=4955 RepID=A0A1G4M6S2_LACFM|nr:LAFE_0A03950g1_1 [Lachancea fermentati]
MNDPFADLLSSFKGGSTDTSSDDLGKKNVSLKAETPVIKATNGNVVDDFDYLFGGTQKKAAPQQQTKDDFDAAFDVFNTPVSSGTPEPLAEVKQPSTPNVEPAEAANEVVDEVKDMEIARLMSLGLSWRKASHYYEQGTTYEHILERRQELHRRSKESNESTSAQYKVNRSDPAAGDSDLFSMASSWISKGREFIDSKLKQVQEDTSSQSFSDYLAARQGPRGQFARMSEDFQRSKSDEGKLGSFTARFKDIDLLGDDVNTSNASQANQTVPTALSSDNRDQENSINPPKHFDTPVLDVAPSHSVEASPESKDANQDLLIDFDTSEYSASAKPTTNIKRVVISELELHGYREFNAKGTKAFTEGDYSTAFENYTKSLNTLPIKHPLRLIALSNIIITQLKLGENKEALKNVDMAFGFVQEDALDSLIQDSSPPKKFSDFWSKIMLRKAEALEHVEDYEKALDSYQRLIEKGVVSPKIMQGKRRCQKVVNPEKFKPIKTNNTKKENSNFSKNTDQSHDNVVDSKPSAKLAHVKRINKKKEEEDAQKFKLHDTVDLRIRQWSQGYESDLRQLLARLSQVLDWCNWREVSTADLVIPKKAKIVYLKAVSKTHPDKIQDSWPLEQKMIAENVFVVLNRAWELFKEENGLS